MAKYCPYCVSRIDYGNVCPYCNYSYFYRPKSHHLKPGTLLNNKYLVGRVLGEGGFGITYVGRDLTLDMKVAIKEYYPSAMASRSREKTTFVTAVDWSLEGPFKAGRDQFVTEAQTIAKMDKESAVVTVRDFFETNNSAYIVMEFVEGSDLRSIVNEMGKPIPADELLQVLEPVFNALDELHGMGLIHRDISPDNIMMENGRARLIDFGCARESLRYKNAETDDKAVLKHSFSPVEQYNNTDMGPWTDIYAMAATIYYCITGKLPPKATDRLAKDELKKPSSLGVKLTAKQERALMKALSIKREDRYQTMAAFGKDLFIHKQKNRWVYAAVLLAAVAAAAFGAYAVYDHYHPEKTSVEIIPVANPVAEIYTLESNIDKAEILMLNKATDLLQDDCILLLDGDHYYNTTITNNTGYNLEDAELSLRCYNEEGTIIRNGTFKIGKWENGTAAKPEIYNGKADETSEVSLMLSFSYNNKKYRTAYIPATVEETERKLDIILVNKLPAKFSYSSYGGEAKYTITGFSFENYRRSNDSYYAYLYFTGSVDSMSSSTSYSYISYRISDESGAILSTGTISFSGYKAGDKFRTNGTYVDNLSAGKYTLELSSYSN